MKLCLRDKPSEQDKTESDQNEDKTKSKKEKSFWWMIACVPFAGLIIWALISGGVIPVVEMISEIGFLMVVLKFFGAIGTFLLLLVIEKIAKYLYYKKDFSGIASILIAILAAFSFFCIQYVF